MQDYTHIVFPESYLKFQSRGLLNVAGMCELNENDGQLCCGKILCCCVKVTVVQAFQGLNVICKL